MSGLKGREVKNSEPKAKQKKLFDKDNLINLALLILFAVILGFLTLEDREISVQIAAGTFLVVTLLLSLFYKDFIRYKPLIYKNHKMMLLIGVLLFGNLITGKVFYYILNGFSIWFGNIDSQLTMYAIPLAAGSMLAALLIDIHTAIVYTVITSLLAGIWLGNPFYSVFTFASGLTAAFGVIRCKKRSAIWRAGLFVSLVSVLTSLIITLTQGQFFTLAVPVTMGFAFLNGLIVAIIVSAFLPLHEHVFKLTTDISLLELVDLSQPLMRNLLLEAPGTYHHSIIVGNLVEAAAEAVGVNPLLARVSAYYHDIGKIKMPEYFIENQTVTASVHDKLAPRMSGLILISHVKEGVELARQHKLPESIIHIIQQHHGSSIITYFYQKAKEHEGDSGTAPTEHDFRYPGPKPQTRVAALVLMADAVEASSRALTEPTPARISALVERVINHYFLDGQLDDCELTLKDLREIKSHFVFMLTSIFHRRVNYPGFEIKDEGTDKKPAEAQMHRQDKDKKGSSKDTLPVKTPSS